ncbi:Binding-protein-dependent transport system inner membrane component [Aneurinibacillus migulanus]|uniref:Glutathione transport system permease protein GsiC n=1 Tax=Aneurinibacillus migulanus TaxID=47500 RepID=A0A1G8Q229_ANEMI|nr:hypothetical protein AMI01nite_14980 [Aneurinibacillus migulanus]SDI98771.1 Binding-protein-dependent transport system inner membrane component [Aneurinibacillus migulanus]
MPSFALGSGVAAIIARFTRSSFMDILKEDYIRTGRAKGLRESTVIWKHALKNAMISVATMTGLQFGFLLSGAIVVETVFNWPGLGRLLIDSISFRDYPVIQAATDSFNSRLFYYFSAGALDYRPLYCALFIFIMTKRWFLL